MPNPTTPTTAETQKLWRLIVLASVCCFKERGATAAGLQRGLELLGRDVIWRCLHELEEADMIYHESVPSGHPSGSRVSRFFPCEGISVDVAI